MSKQNGNIPFNGGAMYLARLCIPLNSNKTPKIVNGQ